MSPHDEKKLHERITQGIQRGVARALKEHKSAGRSISVWKNGKVEKIPPEKIEIRE
jgi:hypothetical protein